MEKVEQAWQVIESYQDRAKALGIGVIWLIMCRRRDLASADAVVKEMPAGDEELFLVAKRAANMVYHQNGLQEQTRILEDRLARCADVVIATPSERPNRVIKRADLLRHLVEIKKDRLLKDYDWNLTLFAHDVILNGHSLGLNELSNDALVVMWNDFGSRSPFGKIERGEVA
jgi:hypothetical protein